LHVSFRRTSRGDESKSAKVTMLEVASLKALCYRR
jgi:hypothetical protein